jgi:2-methylcitrate dehydratase PrpD
MISLSRRLVRVLLEMRAQGIPADIREKTRLHIADAVGIALAARNSLPIAEEAIAAVGAGGSTGPCMVFGGSERLPPIAAAFANSAMIHALDFDDIHDLARLHPTTVTLPAALAAAELVDADGKAIVDGVALGNEVMCRLGMMWKPGGDGPGADWFLTQLFGYLGGTLAAGLVLGLSEDQIVSAFGLAYMQSAGGKEPGFGVGATARSIYPAFAAMGGMQASLLARAGIVGPESALDGTANLFRLYLGQEATPAQIEGLLLTAPWAWSATETKPWPSCRLSHPYVAAALSVRGQMHNEPDAAVERIVVAVNASAARLCRPLEQRRRPQTLQDAKYSIPFMTAFTLANGVVDLNTLDATAFTNAAALALVDRVEIAETLPDNPGHPPAEIAVHTAARTFNSPRHLTIEMPESRVREKFFACLDNAGLADHASQQWDNLLHLDRTGLAAFKSAA